MKKYDTNYNSSDMKPGNIIVFFTEIQNENSNEKNTKL